MTLAFDRALVLWAYIALQSDPERAWLLRTSGMPPIYKAHVHILLELEQELGTCEGLFFPGTLPGPIL